MTKLTARQKKLLEAKEQMKNFAPQENPGIVKTKYCNPNEEFGPSMRSVKSKVKRELKKKIRAEQYKQIVNGTYKSNKTYTLGQSENVGALLKLVNSVGCTRLDLEMGSLVLLVDKSKWDVGNAGHAIKVLTGTGKLQDAKSSWFEACKL
jgi:hypothetical protein